MNRNRALQGSTMLPMRRRNFVKYLSLMMGSAIVVSCTSSPQPDSSADDAEPTASEANSQAPKEIRIGSFSVAVDYAPFLIAKNKGLFEQAFSDQGTKISYTAFQSLPPINEAFATDRIDFVFEAEPPAVIAKAAGIDVKIVGLSCSLVQEILVPTNSSVQSAADLKGKKIAVLAGTSSHYGVIKLIEEAGLEASDVEIIDLVPPDAKNAFATNKVDAWAVWPPFVEQAELDGSGRVLPRGDASINSVVVANSKFVSQYPEAVKQIVKVVQDTKSWILANPDEAKSIVAEELDVPLEVVDKAWPRHAWDDQLSDKIIEDIQAKADFFTANGFIQESVDVKELVDTSYL